jgi:hypothetical protein
MSATALEASGRIAEIEESYLAANHETKET